MNKMRFDIKCVKDCLVNNSAVFTVRSWEGYSALGKVEVDGIGLCTKKRLIRVTRKEDLTQYLSLVGSPLSMIGGLRYVVSVLAVVGCSRSGLSPFQSDVVITGIFVFDGKGNG